MLIGYVRCVLVGLLLAVLLGFLCVGLSFDGMGWVWVVLFGSIAWMWLFACFFPSFCLFMFVGIRHLDVVLYWLLY